MWSENRDLPQTSFRVFSNLQWDFMCLIIGWCWFFFSFFFFLLYILSASTHHPQPPQASTPYSLESESLGMECMISGSASPTLAINTVTNKVLQPAIQPPAPTHTWLHGCTLTPPTSPTSYSTIPHRESSTLLKDTHKHTHTHHHMFICLKLLYSTTHTKTHSHQQCNTFSSTKTKSRFLSSAKKYDAHSVTQRVATW